MSKVELMSTSVLFSRIRLELSLIVRVLSFRKARDVSYMTQEELPEILMWESPRMTSLQQSAVCTQTKQCSQHTSE